MLAISWVLYMYMLYISCVRYVAMLRPVLQTPSGERVKRDKVIWEVMPFPLLTKKCEYKAPEKSTRFLVIGRLQNQCGGTLFFFAFFFFFFFFFGGGGVCQQGNAWYMYMYTQGPNFPHVHVQSMVAKRGLTNWANVHTPTVREQNRLKHSTAEFQQFSIQQFWLQLDIAP